MGPCSFENNGYSVQAEYNDSRFSVSTHTKHPSQVLVVSIYARDELAYQVVERLIQDDFPMDKISVLRRAGGEGDDLLGVSFHDSRERITTWGKHGLFWGGLWGLLASAAGVFVFPGIGPLLMAGPIIELLGATLAGAAITGTAMAGAAVITELSSALHSAGVPEQDIEALHDAVMQGKTLVILHCLVSQEQECSHYLHETGAEQELIIPIWY
jgi:hypothetical protein